MKTKAAASAVCAMLLIAFALVGSAAGGESRRRTVPVPRVTIYPGDIVQASLLTEVALRNETDLPQGVHLSIETVAGQIARRTLIAGQMIPNDAVRIPYAVQQGQSLTLLYEADGLRITLAGEAMQSAGIGELVSVRNVDTGVIVKGRVRDERTALVEAR